MLFVFNDSLSPTKSYQISNSNNVSGDGTDFLTRLLPSMIHPSSATMSGSVLIPADKTFCLQLGQMVGVPLLPAQGRSVSLNSEAWFSCLPSAFKHASISTWKTFESNPYYSSPTAKLTAHKRRLGVQNNVTL